MSSVSSNLCIYCGAAHFGTICPRIKILHADGTVELFPIEPMRSQQGGQGDETAWLVERHDSGQIEYLYFDEGLYWTPDSLKACRFSRRADAEQAASGGELHDLHVVEHRWVKP